MTTDTELLIASISKVLLHTDKSDDGYFCVISQLSSFLGCWCGYLIFKSDSSINGEMVIAFESGAVVKASLLKQSPLHYFIQKDELDSLVHITPSSGYIFKYIGLDGAKLLCPIVVNGYLHGAILLPVQPKEHDFLFAIRSQLEVVIDRIVMGASTRDLYRQLSRLNHNLESMVSSQLIKYREEMEMARRLHYEKTRFLSQMSHDLRTPLHVIVGMSLLLRDKNCIYSEIFPIILSACDHLDDVIHQIFLSIRS